MPALRILGYFYQSCETLHLKLLPLFAEKVSLVDNAMEVMLPSGNPVPANGCLWEGTSSPQLEVSDRTSAAICCNSTLVTRGPGTDVKIPGEEMVGRSGTERRSTTGRRSGSPRAMPLLSVASLSASFHTDTTMSRCWPRPFLTVKSTSMHPPPSPHLLGPVMGSGVRPRGPKIYSYSIKITILTQNQ